MDSRARDRLIAANMGFTVREYKQWMVGEIKRLKHQKVATRDIASWLRIHRTTVEKLAKDD
jgi:hypothetical protein